MRVAVLGGVSSTEVMVRRLVAHGFEVALLLGFEPKDSSGVSFYVPLRQVAAELDLPFLGFEKVSEPAVAQQLTDLRPDVLFVVGISQLVGPELMAAPRLGAIGFHPTRLPKGRGRAAVAWLLLEQVDGAASFFLLGEGADEGPLLAQEPFPVTAQDDAASVERKVHGAMVTALDRWLPRLKQGEWDPVPQDEAEASYYGRRKPEDGLISWQEPAEAVDRLIRASTHPHPGAFSSWRGRTLRVWQASLDEVPDIRGVPGRVLLTRERDGQRHLLVQAGLGALWLTRFDIEGEVRRPPTVGDRLGYQVELEVGKLWAEVKALKARLGEG